MPVSSPTTQRQQHWRYNQRLTLALLLLWALVTFGAPFYAHRLNFSVLGWPVGFWAAAQGALLVYGLIVVCYAWGMHRADRHHLGGTAGED